MSGSEASAVLGLIAAINTIIDSIKRVYGAASDTRGLPEAFREVDARLPIVQNILKSVEKADQGYFGGAKVVVENCHEKVKRLEELFQKVIPGESASRMERKSGGGLDEKILEDVNLLAINHGMTTIPDALRKELAKAIKELAALPPSLSEYLFEDSRFTANHSGSGAINQALGDQYSNPGSGQINHAHNITIGSTGKDESQACLTALFQTLRIDPRDDRNRLIQRKGIRVDGTCEWIKKSQTYTSWLDSRSNLLWLSGGPGKGKTMLSIFLAEELECKTRDSPDAVFLEFFCDNKDETRNTANSIINGLIFQLLELRREAFPHILPTFKTQRQSLFASSSFETLWKIFCAMICDPSLGTIYCVLDGLDECDESSLEVLLVRIKSLFSTHSHGSPPCSFNLVALSRDQPDCIPELLSGFPRIRLDPDAASMVNDDIQHFIHAKVGELSVRRQYSDSLRGYVKKVFQDRAQGTFLWVGIVAKELKNYKRTEVEKALELFPSGLEELYARMLLQIHTDRRKTAARILRWVVMAVRPLTLTELSAALESDIEHSAHCGPKEVIEDHVLNCGHFLTMEENGINLIHQSAKDFLLSGYLNSKGELEIFHIKESVGNLEIAWKCLQVLHNGIIKERILNLKKDSSIWKEFPFLKYAVPHWIEHARSLPRSEDIFDLSLPFYAERSRPRDSWLKLYWYLKPDLVYGLEPDLSELLHVASFFGILQLAENLLVPKDLITPVKQLFEIVRRKNSRGSTALHFVARNGHEAIGRLLIEKGTDIGGVDKFGNTAFYYTCRYRHEALMRFLINEGVDVNVKDIERQTALHHVCRYGWEATLRLLLEKGADIEAKDGNGKTALCNACKGGQEAIVRLLIEKGADIEVKDGIGYTSLHWAIKFQHKDIIWLLLENGADIEAKDTDGMTPFMMAIREGHKGIIRLLIERGADIEVKDKYGDTALHWAVARGCEDIVRVLLEKGVDIEVKDRFGYTALFRAVRYEYKDIVRLLFEEKADIKAKDGSGYTALHWAVTNRSEDMIELLLEKDADIEARDIDGMTPLMIAIKEGDEDIIWLLHENGATDEGTDLDGKPSEK